MIWSICSHGLSKRISPPGFPRAILGAVWCCFRPIGHRRLRAHIVIFPNQRPEGEWGLRLEYDNHGARFLRRTWPSAEEARRWVEANAHTVTR
jgi:hypothetical protein